MQLRSSFRGAGERIRLEMTAMIDIVFLLLVFFVMTFQVVALEGDFRVTMPLGRRERAIDAQPQALLLKLEAKDDGSLSGIRLDGRDFASFAELTRHIDELLGDARGPDSLQESIEIEMDCDPRLDYGHTMAAITAVSGKLNDHGHIVKLIDRIKFTPAGGTSRAPL